MAEKQWRPDNWDKYYHPKGIDVSDPVFIAFEAGFDACLEALRDARFPYPGGQFAGIDITKEGDFLIILKS